MQAAAPAPRHRVYTAVEPRCEWARAADADTLVVDVSGFMKEELKVLYNTSRKLKVAGERPVGDGSGARWARFLKSFPVPKSVRAGGIRAVMDKEQAVLYVILPKGSPPPPPPPGPPPPPPPPSPMAAQKEQQQPGGALPPPQGERKGDGGSSSNGGFWSAQEDAGKKRAEEKDMAPQETRIQIQEEEEIATPDAPRNDGGDDDKMWWEKLTPLHVVGFIVIVLAVVGIGALYATLLL